MYCSSKPSLHPWRFTVLIVVSLLQLFSSACTAPAYSSGEGSSSISAGGSSSSSLTLEEIQHFLNAVEIEIKNSWEKYINIMMDFEFIVEHYHWPTHPGATYESDSDDHQTVPDDEYFRLVETLQDYKKELTAIAMRAEKLEREAIPVEVQLDLQSVARRAIRLAEEYDIRYLPHSMRPESWDWIHSARKTMALDWLRQKQANILAKAELDPEAYLQWMGNDEDYNHIVADDPSSPPLPPPDVWFESTGRALPDEDSEPSSDPALSDYSDHHSVQGLGHGHSLNGQEEYNHRHDHVPEWISYQPGHPDPNEKLDMDDILYPSSSAGSSSHGSPHYLSYSDQYHQSAHPISHGTYQPQYPQHDYQDPQYIHKYPSHLYPAQQEGFHDHQRGHEEYYGHQSGYHTIHPAPFPHSHHNVSHSSHHVGQPDQSEYGDSEHLSEHFDRTRFFGGS